jgi:hypothetical protein
VDSQNPYVGFRNTGDVVSIDPTFGLNDANTTSTGACYESCVRITGSNVAGQCCSCGNRTRTFTKAPWSGTTYICL